MIYKNTIEKFKNNVLGDIRFSIEESIEEAFIIEGDKLRALIRNKKQEGINHHRSFKLKSNIILKTYPNGIPIIFEKIIDGYDDKGNELYHFTWDIDPDAYDNNKDKKLIYSFINNKQKQFINDVLNIAGNIMIEYWALDPKKDYRRIMEIEKEYNGYKI